MNSFDTYDNGFHIAKSFSEERIVYINSDKIEEGLRYYREHNLVGIGISSWEGYKSDDLNFLEKCPDLKGLVINGAYNFDLAPAYKLKKLRYLSVGEDDITWDLSGLLELQELRFSWCKKVTFPEKFPDMKSLHLWKFKSPTKSCLELPDMPNLETLELIQGNFENLNGLERFTNLRHLEIHYCPKLKDISALQKTKLNHITMEHCKNITNYESSAAIKTLHVLRFNGCGKMASIKFISELPLLEDFRFVETNVEDGDMTPCLKLKSVGFFNKRHYSHKCEEIQKLINDPAYLRVDKPVVYTGGSKDMVVMAMGGMPKNDS